MVLDGGAISTSAVTSTFTAIVRVSQAIYELKAVGEQTRDLLETVKYVNSSLHSVRELRRKKSSLLNRDEKEWIDQQVEFTQKAVDNVAALVERARVDMQMKPSAEEYPTKHIKVHHRARFVFEDAPKVATNLATVSMAMNGLNSAMVTLASREGHENTLAPPKAGTRRGTSPGRQAPPAYAEHDFLNRRRTINGTQRKSEGHQEVKFAPLHPPENSQIPPFSPGFGSQTVPTTSDQHSLRSRDSFSSITPSINFTANPDYQIPEQAILSEESTPISPFLSPSSSIRDSIGSDAYYFAPHGGAHELDASMPPSLQSRRSEPNVPTIYPVTVRRPREYSFQHHRGGNPSLSSVASVPELHDEFQNPHLHNPWASSTSSFQTQLQGQTLSHSQSHSPSRSGTTAATAMTEERGGITKSADSQKDLPMLPLNLSSMASSASLNSSFSEPGAAGSNAYPSLGMMTANMSNVSLSTTSTGASGGPIGPPPVSRGRSWLMDRANQVATTGVTSPLSSRGRQSRSSIGGGSGGGEGLIRTESGRTSAVASPGASATGSGGFVWNSPDDVGGGVPGGWPR